MNYLLKNATIYNQNGKWHLKKADILIKRGKIEKIAREIVDDSAKRIESANLCVSVGWLDIGTRLTEPGMEDVDDIRSLCRSAAAGGFTALAVFPNTYPVIDHKGAVETILHRSKDELVTLYPIGAVTQKTEGLDIAEMADMKSGGAIAFSDGLKSIQHAGVMKRALRYVATMGTVIINHPDDQSLRETGIMNEGGESAYMGLKGIPALAEEIMLNRDIRLCEYSESAFLAHLVSTQESVKIIKKARQKDIRVFSSVSWHNLVETDRVLRDFDPMHKVLPPLRTRNDNGALIKGLAEDVIDCIVSNHQPVDVEEKKKAFYYAGYGAIGLEQLFGVLLSRLGDKLPLETLVAKLSDGPRQILNLESPMIAEGMPANLTLFDPDREWTFDKKHIRSKSENAPYLGDTLKGRVLGVMSNNKFMGNDELA